MTESSLCWCCRLVYNCLRLFLAWRQNYNCWPSNQLYIYV